jgi:putative ABC transport system permease protein
VQPLHGRGFVPDEEIPGRNHVAVISHRLWQRRWAAAPRLVGSVISIDGVAHTVVGIAPEHFDYPLGTEIWAPLALDEKAAGERTRRSLDVIARLKPGVDTAAARAEMLAVAALLEREYKESNGGYGVNVMPLSRAVQDIGLPEVMVALQSAVILVLLIAGANVANLLLVRGTARQKELALRLAVGASRWRVVRQLVIESVVLAAGGAALALPLAWAGIRVIRTSMPPEIGRFVRGWDQLDVDGRLLVVTSLAGIVAGAIFGVIPAFRASRPDLTDALKQGGRGSMSSRRRALQALVVVQVALALALLVSAGLSTRGVIQLITKPEGYEPAGVMTFSLNLPEKAYPDEEARLRFYDALLERSRGIAGVEAVAITNVVPYAGGNARRAVEVEGHPVKAASEQPRADFRAVTPAFFTLVRGSVLNGRGFTAEDRQTSPRVAIVNQVMASRLWPGVDPIGKRFRPLNVPDSAWLTIVGVANNIGHDWYDGLQPTFYVPLIQSAVDYATLLVRTRGDEASVVPAVRQVARNLDANLPLYAVQTLTRFRYMRTVGLQYVAAMLASFAGIGLFLAAVGIYGVMAYSVSQRTRELGVRIALGATARQVMNMTLRDAVTLTSAGIAIGLLAAFALGKVMVANLFGVVQLDAITFIVFAGVLAVVAVIAGSVPARRAMRVDPIVALRTE